MTTAIAKSEAGPGTLIKQYQASFEAVLPSHIKPATWIRVAQGALKRGKKQGGKYELELAAANNPGVFLAAMLDAARMGLEPGTEEYYLTPRKVKGRLEILGIVGYQGYIELMYRAGAISGVIAEVVRTKDVFRYQPGRDEIPDHEIDWDSDDRGELRLVYAYAKMKDGAYSRVIVLNRRQIEDIRKSAQGSSSEYSPWQSNPEAMWLKSAVRQLRKWVPTSAEYILTQARAAAESNRQPSLGGLTDIPDDHTEDVIVDAEIVDEETGEITGGLAEFAPETTSSTEGEDA